MMQVLKPEQVSATFAQKSHRIFISSTFRDMDIERMTLRERVFPILRHFAVQNGWAFRMIDLQWGISLEDARRQNTMALCLRELERCYAAEGRPYLLFLLGQRHGWTPPPARLPEPLGKTLARMFSDAGLFETWYQLDQNAIPPDYKLAEISPSHSFEDLERLGEEIRNAASTLDLKEDHRLLLLGSATEQEIAYGLSRVDSATGLAVIGIVRTILTDPLPTKYRSNDQTAELKQKRLIETVTGNVQDLLQENINLVDGHLPADYLDRVSTFVVDTIQKHSYPTPEPEIGASSDAEANRRLMDQYVDELVVLEQTRSFVAQVDSQDSMTPLAVIAPAGMGKTSLLSYLARQRARSSIVIVRLIGAAPPRPQLLDLLESIISEIADKIGDTFQPNPTQTLAEASHELERGLYELASRQPLTLIVDGLDQLQTPAAFSPGSWLPRNAPPNVRIIVSSRPAHWLDEERSLLKIELPSLDRENADQLLSEVLRRENRRLQPIQLRTLVDASNGIPLLLRLNAINAMGWTDQDQAIPMTTSVDSTGGDLLRLLTGTLGQGKRLTILTLGLLFSAKQGLNEEELLGALSFDSEILAEQRERSPDSPHTNEIPYAVWSRLLGDLAPYLSTLSTMGGPVWTLMHRSVMGSIEQELTAADLIYHCHHLLVEYFSKQPWTTGAERILNVRKLIEHPFHLAQCGLFDEYWTVVTNPIILTATFELSGLPGLEELLELGEGHLDALRQTDLDILRRKIRGIAPTAMTNRIAFPSLLDSQLRDGMISVSTLQSGLTTAHRPWLRRASLPNILQGGTFIDMGDGVGAVAVSADSRIMAAVGYELLQVNIWDLESQALIASIRDASQPIGLSPDSRYCVTGGLHVGEIRITEISTLKTVAVIEAAYDDRDRRIALTQQSLVLADGQDVLVFNLQDGQKQAVLQCTRDLTCAGASANGKIIVGGCRDGSLVIFRPQQDNVFVDGHPEPVRMLTVSADGAYAVSAGEKEVILWELETGNVQLLARHLSTVRAVDISADGSVVAWNGTFEETAYAIDSSVTSEARSVGNHTSWVEGVAVSPDGKTIYTGSRDGTIQATPAAKTPDAQSRAESAMLDGRITTIHPTSDEKNLFVTSYGRSRNFACADPSTGRISRFWSVHTEDVNDVSMNGDCSLIASVSDDGRLIVRTNDGGMKWMWKPRRGSISCVDMTKDGNWIAIGFLTVNISYLEGLLRSHTPTGTRIPEWLRADGEVWLLNLARRRRFQWIRAGESGVSAVSFLSGDQLLATLGSPYGTLSVWGFERAAGKLTLRWTLEDQYIEAITSHPESDILITADSMGHICGYDAVDGTLRWSLDTKSNIQALAFAPRVQRLLSVDARGHVNLIDLKNLKPIASTIVVGATEACALSENGQRVWIGCGNEVQVFDLQDNLGLEHLKVQSTE